MSLLKWLSITIEDLDGQIEASVSSGVTTFLTVAI